MDVRWEREVPEDILALGLAQADYADLVSAPLPPGPARTPEQWMIDGLRVLPDALTRVIPWIHRGLLGLRVELAPSADRPLGWTVADRTADHIAIEASGPLMAARVVVHIGRTHGSLASFVRYERRAAAVIWPPVSLIHRRVAITLVRSSGAVMRQSVPSRVAPRIRLASSRSACTERNADWSCW